jgi:hypothetical protein
MRRGSGLVVVSVVSFSFAALAAPSAADAGKKLETARTNLTQAVERIKKDPPANEDLDAAHAAVEALKDVIDQGAELEQSDLDYAKAALAARKELRTQRDYVDDRRAKTKIFDARRGIDAALKTLNDAMGKVQAKEAGAADFAAARDQAAAVKKVLDGSRELGKQDPGFAAFVTQTDAALVQKLKAVDDRELGVAVEAQRAKLSPARDGLKTALGSIQKGASDDAFHAGDAAAAAVAKSLDEGKALEAKSPAYRGDADKARAELAAAKKKMEDAFSATGLVKLKGEIDPSYKDLLAAAKPLRGKPSAEQIAEAKTATLVVRKLVEKFGPEAAHSAAFGAYLDGVKKTLADTETDIEKRSLAAAERDVANAQKAVQGKEPSDDQFKELAAAVNILDKTLGGVHQDEPLMAASVKEAQLALKDARAVAAKRRLEVDSDREKKTLAGAQKDVTNARGAVEKKDPADGAFAELSSAINVLEKTLGTVHKDEPLMQGAVKDAQKTLDDAKAVAAKRRVEVDSDHEKKTLAGAQSDVSNARKAVEKKDPADDAFTELGAAINVLEKTLGTIHKDEPLMQAAVKDAQKALDDAKAVAARRRVEVDSDHEKKSLQTAQKDVLVARGVVEKKTPQPTDEQFDILKAAVGVLEKTLGAVHKDEPLMKDAVNEATIVVRDSKAIQARRRLEVDVERQQKKVEDARKIAADAMKQLDANQFAKEQITAAENAVKLIGTVLEQGKGLMDQDKNYKWYDGEIQKRVAELNTKIAAKKVVLAASDARTALTELVAQARAKIEALKQPEAKDADVDAAVAGVDAINKFMEGNAALEKQAYSYGVAAEKVRNAGGQILDNLELAKEMREVRKKTGEALAAGSTDSDAAAAVKDLRKRKIQYERALSALRSCQSEGPPLLAANPPLAKINVLMNGQPSTPREVIAACQAKAEATEQLMKDVAPLIKFEDGPRKAYETAKAQVSKNKGEALKQFNECIATGIILQHDNPELTDHKFEVASSSMTLGEVVKECVAQKKALSK